MKLETSVLFKKNLAHKENIRQLTAGELKRVQEILFGILCAVDEVCKKRYTILSLWGICVGSRQTS